MIEPIQMPEGYYRSRARLALELLDAGVVRLSHTAFRFDPNLMTSRQHALAARCMAHIRLGKHMQCDSVYGLDKTDIALAEAFSHSAGVKRIDLDFQAGHRCSVVVRNHGGPTHARKAVVLRHQVRTGVIIRKTISEVRETTVEADHVITLLDWEEGATDVLEKHGVELHSVFARDDLLDIYVETGRLSRYGRASIGWNSAFV